MCHRFENDHRRTEEDAAYRYAAGEGGGDPPPTGDISYSTDAGDDELDLSEVEQLHEEAERMKGLGNKHMANQVSGHRRVVVT